MRGQGQAEKGGSLNKALFDRSVDIAIAWSKAKVAGHVSFKLAAQYALYDRLGTPSCVQVSGGQLHYAVSGGGLLGERPRTSSTRWVQAIEATA